MGRYASDSGNTFQQAPIGTHVARCYGVIDIGTHHGEYQGEPNIRDQIIIQWELPNELMEDGKPYIASAFYTNSLNEKAKLRAHLVAWRGRDFTDEEREKFDLANIIGKPCMLTIIANQKGKHVVSAVSAMPKGMACPNQINASSSFWIDEWDQDKFDALSDGLKKLIMDSDEYKARNGGTKPAPAFGEPFDDEITF